VKAKRREKTSSKLEPQKKPGILSNTGGIRDKKKIFPRLVKDDVKRTNIRRISAEQKPKRNSLIQILGSLNKAAMKPPPTMKRNHKEQEKRERAE
jgi:hypothetical protein